MKNNKTFGIVIPSYNEVENISILLKKIYKMLPKCKIVIVDDSKKSENTKLKKILKNKRNVTLLSRLKKSGRGSAVLDGFKKILENKSVEYVFEMDSDLAHDPAEFNRFIKKTGQDKYDLIIGSRYLPGGKIINISKDRTILSRVINKFLYYWLGMGISDHTSGFRLYKRKSVEYLVRIGIKSKGFITLSEMAYLLFLNKFSITEVPITWNYRLYGKSNVNIKELINSLYFVIRMKLEYFFLSKTNGKRLLILLFIFLLAFSIRISTLNQMGRTWDEPEYIEQGYKMDQLLLKKDFGNSFFYTTYDHPPLVKYIYGITAHFDIKEFDSKGNPVFNYDYTHSRLLSAFFASLSAVIVVLIALEFSSVFIALISGIIFSTLPFFVGLSQLVTTESVLMLLFNLGIYLFLKFLKYFSYKKTVLIGVVTGLALLSKQSNALLFPIYGLFYVVYHFTSGVKEKLINIKVMTAAVIIIIIFALTFVVLWPMPYAHLDVVAEINKKIWLVKTAPPEVFWGMLILSPKIYFVTFFFITTPLLIIILFLLGLKHIDIKKNWIYYCLIIWFLFPFVQSFYAWRMHGLRYIIEIYAPLSIIAALGVERIILYFRGNKKIVRFIIIILILTYSFIELYKITPYYLNYYNEIMGGAKGVYDKRYFHLGWWGEGMREAGLYLVKNAKNNSTVGLAVSPIFNFPKIEKLKLEEYNPKKEYDYIVVTYYRVLREGFDDSQIKSKYKLVYEVMAGGAPIVYIYSK